MPQPGAAREQGQTQPQRRLLAGASRRAVYVARAPGSGVSGLATLAGRAAGLALLGTECAAPVLAEPKVAVPLAVVVLAVLVLAELEAVVLLAQVSAATCYNAPGALTPAASGVAVLRRVSGFLPPRLRCPGLCYHSATQSGHRLASALAQAWEVPPGCLPAWVAAQEVLASPARAPAWASSPAPVSVVPGAFWWAPVTVWEATAPTLALPGYVWPQEQEASSHGREASAAATARVRGGRPIGVYIRADGISSWQSVLKSLPHFASCHRSSTTAPHAQRLWKPCHACSYTLHPHRHGVEG